MEFRHFFKSSAVLLALCPALSMPVAAGVSAATADNEITFTFSYPAGAKGQIAYKDGQKHYVPFIGVEPISSTTVDGIITETYQVQNSSNSYNYRVSRDGCMTQAGIFAPSRTNEISVSEELLAKYAPGYFNYDRKACGGLNYADVYLNINKRNLLRMTAGETFQIVNLRTWQLTNSTTGNYFLEPDYNWTVLNTDFQPDNSVVSVDENGILTAHKTGTAIVQVRYDAICTNYSTFAGAADPNNENLWSAIWAENTGTFVVTVDADAESAPADNIHLYYKPQDELDCESDIMYYMQGEAGYRLSFRPADGSTVSVANPLIDLDNNTVSYPNGFSSENVSTDAEGNVTVLLTHGRNIIRTTDAAGNSNYQVLSAKPITMNIVRARDDNYILPGDRIFLQFDGLYHMSGKLAGIYNNNCHIRIEDKILNDGVFIGSGQYDFAGNAAAQKFPEEIPVDAHGKIVFGNGRLVAQGYGSAPGAHRGVTYTEGITPNFAAGTPTGEYGSIPDQIIEVADMKDVREIAVTVEMGARVQPLLPAVIEKYFGKNAMWEVPEDAAIRVREESCELIPVRAGACDVTLRNTDAAANGGPEQLVCHVTVPENPDFIPVTGISYTGEDPYVIHMNLSWGNWGTNYFSVKVEPSDATNKTLVYTSSNPEMVGLNSIGNGTYSSSSSCKLYWSKDNVPGESEVTVESVDGAFTLPRPVKVIFKRYASGISLAETESTVEIGKDITLTASVSPEESSYGPEWSSADPEIATVSEDGVVTGVAEGETTITAAVKTSASGYAKATCRLTVTGNSGVDGITASAWGFSPNPCSGTLNVTSNADGLLEIYSLAGERVLAASVTAGVNTFDVSHLASGFYIIRMGNNSAKLIKN